MYTFKGRCLIFTPRQGINATDSSEYFNFIVQSPKGIDNRVFDIEAR